MKSRIRSFTTAFIVTSAFTFGQPSLGDDQVRDPVKAQSNVKTPLKFTVENNLYPALFVSAQTGLPSGYVIDLVNQITAKTGVQFEFVTKSDLESEQAMFRDKRVDVVLFENPDRAEHNLGPNLATLPFSSQRFLLVNTYSSSKNVGVVARTERAKSYFSDYLKDQENVIFIDSVVALEEAISIGSLGQLFLSEEILTPSFLSRNSAKIELHQAQNLATLSASFAFQPEHLEQYLLVNEYLSVLEYHEIDQLRKKYTQTKVNIGFNRRTIWSILFATVMASAAVGFHLRRRHQRLQHQLKTEEIKYQTADKTTRWLAELLEALPVAFQVFNNVSQVVVENKKFREAVQCHDFPPPEQLDTSGQWTSDDSSQHYRYYKSYFNHPESNEQCLLILWSDISQLEKQKLELEKAYQAINSALAVREQFTAMVSHELRTPIAAIVSALELVEKRYKSSDQNTVLFHSIRQAAADLEHQVTQLLDHSKTKCSEQSLEVTRDNLLIVIDQQLLLFDSLCREKGLIFEIDWTATQWLLVETDHVKIKQIIQNLLSNAIKFTRFGKVSIKLQLSKTGLNFKIQDTGIGIAKEQLNTVFEPYQQVESVVTREFGGTGLGLSIVKSNIDALGGQITIESSLGRGTYVEIDIPVDMYEFRASSHWAYETKNLGLLQWLDLWGATSEANGQTEQCPYDEQKLARNPSMIFDIISSQNQERHFREHNSCGGLNLVLIEDNDILRTVLTEQLMSLGVTVSAFNSADKAYQFLQGKPDIDLVISDCHMPLMSGIEFTERVRTDLNLTIPIIGITAERTEQTKNLALEAGMNKLLIKPCTLEELSAVAIEFSLRLHDNKSFDWVDKLPLASKQTMLSLVVSSFTEDLEKLTIENNELSQLLHRIKSSASILEIGLLLEAIEAAEESKHIDETLLEPIVTQMQEAIRLAENYLGRGE